MTHQECTFYPDFTIKTYTESYDGEIVLYKEYDKDGNITYLKSKEMELHQKNNLHHGDFIQYFPNGNKMYQSHYTNGQINGLDLSWFEDGTLKHEAEYVYGKVFGEYKHYYSNGKLRMINFYENNKKIWCKKIDLNGVEKLEL